jgi:hypothetical protein
MTRTQQNRAATKAWENLIAMHDDHKIKRNLASEAAKKLRAANDNDYADALEAYRKATKEANAAFDKIKNA